MRRTAPLILGAGPAGCAAAIALARRGVQPVLLDRDAEARDQLCGGFLSWRTAARLRELGVDPVALGARRLETLAVFAGRNEVALPLPETAFAISRRALDQAMRDRALVLGARLAIDHARGMESTTVLGRERAWTGNGLFLATGQHDLRGLPRPRQSRDPALGLRLRVPASAAREALLEGSIELHLFAGGYAGIVLQEDGSANLCLAVRKSLLARSEGDPARMLADMAGAHPAFALRLGAGWQCSPIETVGAVPYGWIARDTAPGVFRLGDQAAVIPSLAGEGIAIALASGALAARHWLKGGAEGAAAYQRELAALATRPVGVASVARAIAENRLAATQGIALAARVPPVLRYLMRACRLEPEPMLARSPARP